MRIIKAKHYWFCFWVKRAYNLVLSHLNKKWKAQVWGELIHNAPALRFLASKWMSTIEHYKDIWEEIIIRSHWISEKTLNEIKKKTNNIHNATCPFVINVHKEAKKFESEWRVVIIIWHSKHPEMIWVIEDLVSPICVNSEEEIHALPFIEKVWILAQTTLKVSSFEHYCQLLSTKSNDIIISNTICSATEERQAAVRELAQQCDLVIIIWWKKSSNSKKLEEIASQYCQTQKIEEVDELDPTWFDNKETIWISAWASTPDFLITQVEEAILSFTN